MLDSERQECQPLAKRVILVWVLPVIVVATFATYFYLEGALIALLHTLVVLTWSWLLTNIMLTRFRKLPFTCSLPVFKQHSIVILICFCFGFLIYAGSTPEFESWALAQPLQLLRLVPVAVLAWYVPRYLDKNTIELEKRLMFEESSTRTVEVLRLSE